MPVTNLVGSSFGALRAAGGGAVDGPARGASVVELQRGAREASGGAPRGGCAASRELLS